MKVIENIDRFSQKRDSLFHQEYVPEEDFRQGLSALVRAVIPCRKDKDECITIYIKVRDELPLTKIISEKAGYFGPDPEAGRRVIDNAVLKVIYEDRYSFGHLYEYLLSRFDRDVIYDYFDSEAPYKQSVIEYAVEYDLEDTVKKYDSIGSLDERLEYALDSLSQSRQRVLVDHPVKERFEEKLSILVEGCKKGISQADTVLREADSKKGSGPSAPVEENNDNQVNSRPSHFAYNYIIDSKNRKRLMDYLHGRMTDKNGQNALAFIQAAINAGLMTRPEYQRLLEEFGHICSKSDYYEKVSENGGHFPRLQSMINQETQYLKEHFN